MQCSSSDEAQEDTFHADRRARQYTSHRLRGQSRENEQVATAATRASPRSGDGRRDWSARICASIACLMEIDGISMDPKRSSKLEEKNRAKAAEQAFNERVDRLEAATAAAHKKHWDRLQHMYSASTAKKMRLTSMEPPLTTVALQSKHDLEALAALATTAAQGAQLANEHVAEGAVAPPLRQSERTGNRLQDSVPLGAGPGDTAGKQQLILCHMVSPMVAVVQYFMFIIDRVVCVGTKRKPVQVHDPSLVQAVGKLTDKLMQLLVQHQLASDAAAAEPILAAAAAIALEATEMGRREKVALARMKEIETHRLRIAQGLLEYEQRKEEREKRRGAKRSASD
ncbi:unnamed protein product [Hyaloperonospora brassicae]|uniref:Uncharacterized protein n=1 Tax=Hyaloperonospora brassicae TaxID=162125 RepID=A0AAV0U9Y9_HYABA|nr:unnamed protein product [Hyaloperonospora brassicae]